jgi:hypothetical protein
MKENLRKNKFNNGYIGLVSLLIGVAIISFIIMRSDLFKDKKDGKNTIEEGREMINQADNAKNLIEQNSRRYMEE